AYRPTNEERLLSLQIAYIISNEFPIGEKDKLDYANEPETYHTVHRQYHPTYRALLYEKNYYDIFFFDLKGNLIYSVYKELDFATNFAADGIGEWRNSGLGVAYRAAMAEPDEVHVIDWAPYGPSSGKLASFLSIGVKRENQLVGVFSIQLVPALKPRNSSRFLEDAGKDLTKSFQTFRYGSLEDKIQPVPTQRIADNLIATDNVWAKLAPLLEQEVMSPRKSLESGTNLDGSEALAVSSLSIDLGNQARSLSKALLDDAWLYQPALEGAKILLVTEQLSLLHRLTRNVVRWALAGQG
ncbi:Methyl-accepting chemotaxis sensor/transducer protein (Fragment), partial [Durusdinium trenchii]